jgi:integrase
MGMLRMQEIQPAHINQLYLAKREEGRGARTIQLVHATLYNIFKQAMKEGIVGRNPVEAVSRPKVEKAEMQILTEEQARQMVIASRGIRYGTLFYLALITGMREGELLGLKWSDLDWDRGILTIQRQLARISGQGRVFTQPKTKAGRRQIKLGQATLERLADHKEEQYLIKKIQDDRWVENDLIFPNTLGKPMACENMYVEFKKFLKANGMPDIRFHDLRHTSISFLLDMGMPINTVQQRAGHSKASVTTDTYGHSMAHSQDEAAELIDELINPVAVKLQ